MKLGPKPVAFIDCESTALPPNYRPWEIAFIVRQYPSPGAVHETSGTILVSDVDLSQADQRSLEIGRFEERFNRDLGHNEFRYTEWQAAQVLADWLLGCTLVAAQPQFDEGLLLPLMERHGYGKVWDRRLRDIESMTYGGLGHDPGGLVDCARALDVDVDPERVHTAMGDALLVRACFDTLVANPWLR